MPRSTPMRSGHERWPMTWIIASASSPAARSTLPPPTRARGTERVTLARTATASMATKSTIIPDQQRRQHEGDARVVDQPQRQQGRRREEDRDPDEDPRVPAPPHEGPLVPAQARRRRTPRRRGRRLPAANLARRDAQSRPQVKTCVGVTATITESETDSAASRGYCGYFA